MAVASNAAVSAAAQRRGIRGSIAICAGWIGYSLVEAAQYRRQWSVMWPDLSYLDSAQLLMLRTLTIWLPLTFAFLALARHVPLVHDRWPRSVLKVGAALAAAIVWEGLMEWAVDPLLHHLYHGWRADAPSALVDALWASAQQYHTRTYLILLVCYAWMHLRTTHENRLRIAELERGVAHARLDAVSASMHPRFLFDALDTIARLAHRDPDAADRTLLSLSSLLRFNLGGGVHEVTVEREVAFASDFFAIERARVGADFDVRWSVESDCDDALVPALIVQALAERVLGAARVPLRVTLRRHGARLVVDVAACAPTPGATEASPDTLAPRLAALYGGDCALTLDVGADGCRFARLDLPWRVATDARTAA